MLFIPALWSKFLTRKEMVMDGTYPTEPNKKKKEYRRNEGRLARRQRLISVGNWDWNLETKEYSWSDKMYQIFNLKPQQFPLRTGTFLKCVHPEDKQKVVRALGKALVGEQSYNIDHRIVWLDGSVRFIHGEAAVTFDKIGRPIRIVGTVQDITVMQQTE
jgi:two-component system, sensor histidine kinase PdtaS